jgi:transcriptional regulator with AbiEi antitoxin domain of type IV toxin-antitoxin system
MMKIQNLILSAERTIKECFNDVPFIKVIKSETPGNDAGQDYILYLETPFGRKTIYTEISTNGQPRFARILIRKVSLLPEDSKIYWVFVAPFISEKTGEMLRGAGIGFIDLVGNCFISFGGLHIKKEGKKNPYLGRSHFNSLFQKKASRVLRVLLSYTERYWKIMPLAKEAQVSVGHVYNVKEELLNREWAAVDARGIKLNKPENLLQEWCNNYQFESTKLLSFYSLLKTAQLEKQIEEVCRDLKVRYAFSGFTGAARLAPFVRYHRIHCYVENSIAELAKSLDLKSITSGENIILMKPSDDGVFYNTQCIEGAHIVSPIQLYLDLKALSDRGKEAADFIYKEVIEPKWKIIKCPDTASEL